MKKVNITVNLILYKIVIICVLCVSFSGCKKDTYEQKITNDQNAMSKFISEYSLVHIKSNENLLKFNSIDEAKQYLNNLNFKTKKIETRKMLLNSKESKGNNFVFTYKENTFKNLRFKSLAEDTPYGSSHAFGIWSFDLAFDTSEPGVIDENSITVTLLGFTPGITYTQGKTSMLDSDSFLVHGTILYGLEVLGMTLGTVTKEDIRFDMDWPNMTMTWTVI